MRPRPTHSSPLILIDLCAILFTVLNLTRRWPHLPPNLIVHPCRRGGKWVYMMPSQIALQHGEVFRGSSPSWQAGSYCGEVVFTKGDRRRLRHEGEYPQISVAISYRGCPRALRYCFRKFNGFQARSSVESAVSSKAPRFVLRCCTVCGPNTTPVQFCAFSRGFISNMPI